jgi:hypothetical protein
MNRNRAIQKKDQCKEDLHSMVLIPENAVVVIVLCRIEPEVHAFFPSSVGAPVAIDVSLKRVFVASADPKKLQIELVVVLRVNLLIRGLHAHTSIPCKDHHKQ